VVVWHYYSRTCESAEDVMLVEAEYADVWLRLD
jgi:hypothetical protein